MPLPKVRQLTAYKDFEVEGFDEEGFYVDVPKLVVDFESEGFEAEGFYTDESSPPARVIPPVR
jgi:hypothetical protein